MSRELRGLYLITDDTLTPNHTIISDVKEALDGGVGIIQLRDKVSSEAILRLKIEKLQLLAHRYDALFILNDHVKLAIEMGCDGLHIGKSDYEGFDAIRSGFGGIIGVSCYGDIDRAMEFESRGADYVAFGSFYPSPTKPESAIVPLKVLHKAKKHLTIPICAIGGINTSNVDEVIGCGVDMVSLISDVWCSDNREQKCRWYQNKFTKESK